jgi:hypothetical protein
LRNKYEIRGDIVAIKLKNKKGEEYETLIDLDDFDKVDELNLSWHLKWDKGMETYYCKATKYLGYVDGKPKYQTVHLHAVIINNQKEDVDHINHNTLDNRKSNLRIKNRQDNSLHRLGSNKNSTTGVRNVSYSKVTNKYIVQLQINGKNVVFGKFDKLEDAAKCAEENRKKYYSAHIS